MKKYLAPVVDIYQLQNVDVLSASLENWRDNTGKDLEDWGNDIW